MVVRWNWQKINNFSKMRGIMQDPEPRNKRPDYAHEAGHTGTKITARKIGVPFFGKQGPYRAFIDLSFGSNDYVVWIVYRPLDKDGNLICEPAIVAGYVSPPNKDISEFFSPENKYRIGVSADDISYSISERIDIVQDLIEQATDDQRVDLELKHKILATRLTKINELRDAKWTHAILATGWRYFDRKERKFVDRLDLNLDFFDFFYPKEAFPIEKRGEQPAIRCHRNFFLFKALFPEGKLVESKHLGLKLWNRYEWKMGISASQKFPNLKITFNHAPLDVWSQESGKIAKLMKRWPTITDVVDELDQELRDNPYGRKADLSRRKAMKWAERFLRRCLRLKKKKGKKKFARKNCDAMESLVESVAASLSQELDKLESDLENLEDPTDPAFTKLEFRTNEKLSELQMIPGGDDKEKDKHAENAMRLLAEKYGVLAGKLLDELEEMDVNDPQFKEKKVKLGNSIARGMLYGSSGPSKSLVERNAAVLEERYKRNPVLDEKLKQLIAIHVLFLNSDVPKSLSGDSNITAYVEHLRSTLGKVPFQPPDLNKAEIEVNKGESIQKEKET